MSVIRHPAADVCGEILAPEDALPAFVAHLVPESDLAFYSRRALEEAAAAQRAPTPQAAAAHRYLSCAYAERVRRAAEAEEQLDALIETLP